MKQSLEEVQRENGELRRQLNIERRKVRDLWRRMHELERQQSTDIRRAEVPHGI